MGRAAHVTARVLHTGVRHAVHDGVRSQAVGRPPGHARGAAVVTRGLGWGMKIALEAVGLLELGRVAHRAGALAAPGARSGPLLEEKRRPWRYVYSHSGKVTSNGGTQDWSSLHVPVVLTCFCDAAMPIKKKKTHQKPILLLHMLSLFVFPHMWNKSEMSSE